MSKISMVVMGQIRFNIRGPLIRTQGIEWWVLPVLVVSCFFSCKESYSPRVITRNHFLVVEGDINAGKNPTTIRLTRTRNLTDTGSITNVSGTTDTLFELHAEVRVEDSAGNRFPLPELEKGQYGGIPLSLNPEQKYRLYIRTASGKEYVS